MERPIKTKDELRDTFSIILEYTKKDKPEMNEFWTGRCMLAVESYLEFGLSPAPTGAAGNYQGPYLSGLEAEFYDFCKKDSQMVEEFAAHMLQNGKQFLGFGEKEIDWNAEATRLGEMREKAIRWLESVLTPDRDYRVGAQRTRYATVGKVLDTGEVVVAWTDEDSGIDTGWCSMRDTCNDAEVIRFASEVQKAIEGGKQS